MVVVVFSTPCKKDTDLLIIITNNINGTQPHAMQNYRELYIKDEAIQ